MLPFQNRRPKYTTKTLHDCDCGAFRGRFAGAVRCEPMRRRIFVVACVVSVLLWGCVLVLWTTSYTLGLVACVKDSREGPVLPEIVRRQVAASEQASSDVGHRHSNATRYWFDVEYELHFEEGRVRFVNTYDVCEPLSSSGRAAWPRSRIPRIAFRAAQPDGQQWLMSTQSLALGASRDVTQVGRPGF